MGCKYVLILIIYTPLQLDNEEFKIRFEFHSFIYYTTSIIQPIIHSFIFCITYTLFCSQITYKGSFNKGLFCYITLFDINYFLFIDCTNKENIMLVKIWICRFLKEIFILRLSEFKMTILLHQPCILFRTVIEEILSSIVKIVKIQFQILTF